MESRHQRQTRTTPGLRCWHWSVAPPLTAAPPLLAGRPPPLGPAPRWLLSLRRRCQLCALQSQTKRSSCRWHSFHYSNCCKKKAHWWWFLFCLWTSAEDMGINKNMMLILWELWFHTNTFTGYYDAHVWRRFGYKCSHILDNNYSERRDSAILFTSSHNLNRNQSDNITAVLSPLGFYSHSESCWPHISRA